MENIEKQQNDKKEKKEKKEKTQDILLCPECDGSGYTKKGRCELCKGKGLIDC